MIRAEDGRHWKPALSNGTTLTTSRRKSTNRRNRTLAVGDRLQFRHPDNRRNIANGQFAVLTAIGATETTIRFHGKQNRELTLPFSAMRHVDYGYSVSSLSSQGSTVDRVVNDDSMELTAREPRAALRQHFAG